MILLLTNLSTLRASFDLSLNVTSPSSFTTSQLQVLDDAILEAEALWENVITGYQPGISIGGISISVISGSSFADARVISSVSQGGFQLTTAGRIRINPGVIDLFGNWDGSGPNPPNTEFVGVNYIDELIAHEIGHVLGIGTQWTINGLYNNGTGEFTGEYGTAAYRDEFDSEATFVPVELAGSSGTQNSHWDQRMRSSSQEGNPSDPWSLDPRVGITDPQGRDLALELMTGAIDPDYGEPFVSLTTIASMRDMGFTVTVPEDFDGDDQVEGNDLAIWHTGFGSTGLQIDSITYGDSQRDRDVDGADFLAWQQTAAIAVPEPAACILALSWLLILQRLNRFQPRRHNVYGPTPPGGLGPTQK